MPEILQTGNTVVVTAEWLATTDRNKKRAVINGFQTHGHQRYAQLIWLGRETYRLVQDYGTLFQECDLRKVK